MIDESGIEQLSDNDVEVRRAAVVGLLRNHSLESAKNAVPALMEALNDSDVKVSANAAIVLGVIGDPAAVPALQKALSDEREMGGHKIVRVQAAQALERIDTPEAREALSQWKRNESN